MVSSGAGPVPTMTMADSQRVATLRRVARDLRHQRCLSSAIDLEAIADEIERKESVVEQMVTDLVQARHDLGLPMIGYDAWTAIARKLIDANWEKGPTR